MNPHAKQPARDKKTYFKGLLIGFLPIIALCLLVFDRPSDVTVFFTGMPMGLNNRALKIPLACLVFGLFIWLSLKLHRSRKITLVEQGAMVLVAALIVAIWFWVFVRMLESAFRNLAW